MMDLYKIYSTALRKFVMTSREIVIDLIDKGLITGEQAFTLINDIVAAEIKEALEVLNESKKNLDNNWLNTQINKDWISVSSNPTWTYMPTSTCATTLTSNLNDSSSYALASNVANSISADASAANANSNVINVLKADDRTYTLKIGDTTIGTIGSTGP